MDETRSASRPLGTARSDARWTLTVVAGAVVGARCVLTRGSAVELGRNGSGLGEGALTDPRLSRRHVRIEVDVDDCAHLRDLGSRNGTFVNGNRVEALVLHDPQVVCVGSTALLIDRQPLASPRDPPEALTEAAAGISSVFRDCLVSLADASSRSGPVLFVGETGVGKTFLAELSAERLRPGHPMTVADCTSVGPGDLDRLAEAHAAGAIVLLERVDELDTIHYPELARAVTQGGLHARLMATSAVGVRGLLDSRGMPPSLVHRLCRWPIVLPPLRGRLSDLGRLAQAFVARHLGVPRAIDPALVLRMLGRDWPGNLHELEAFIERCVAAADDDPDSPIGFAPGAKDLLDSFASEPPSTPGVTMRGLTVGAGGQWFQWEDEPPISLHPRSPVARVLEALAEHATGGVRAPVPVDRLVAEVWPHEPLVARSGRNRLYVALTALRKVGLGGAIERGGGGYRLSPSIRVSVVARAEA